VAQFEKASTLDPQLAAAHFQLYNIYRQSARSEDAAKQLAIFKDRKAKTEGAAIPEDVDWCNYAEIYDPPHPTSKVAPAKPVYERPRSSSRGQYGSNPRASFPRCVGQLLFRLNGFRVILCGNYRSKMINVGFRHPVSIYC